MAEEPKEVFRTMFIRRQDLIDSFASNFGDTADGRILFQPWKSKVQVPVTLDEYADVMAAFERVQTVNMEVTWIAFLIAGAVGLEKLISDDVYAPFFISLGLAIIFSFALHLRDGLNLLLPFIERREALIAADQHGAEK